MKIIYTFFFYKHVYDVQDKIIVFFVPHPEITKCESSMITDNKYAGCTNT